MANSLRPDYRIRTNFKRPDLARYAEFKDFPTAAISDSYRKRQTLPADIKPLYAGCPGIVGPALTIQVTPGDEILALKALEVAQPGDVVVVTGARSDYFSLWGGIMSNTAHARGIAGLVTDGMVRDIDEVRELSFPIYCTGHLPTAPNMDSPPGDMGYPIPFGQVIINPGDLIVADEQGVVAVPQDELEELAVAVKQRLEWESNRISSVRQTKVVGSIDKVKVLLDRREVQWD